MYTSKPCVCRYNVHTITITNVPLTCTCVCLHRLYQKFTLETVLATSFGRCIDVQNGEAHAVFDATIEVLNFLQERNSIGIQEMFLVLCKL